MGRNAAELSTHFRSMTPDLVSLELALRLSEERVVPFGVDKALLYITPADTRGNHSLLTLAEQPARLKSRCMCGCWAKNSFNNDQGRALINCGKRYRR